MNKQDWRQLALGANDVVQDLRDAGEVLGEVTVGDDTSNVITGNDSDLVPNMAVVEEEDPEIYSVAKFSI